jgi:hypothetical protein
MKTCDNTQAIQGQGGTAVVRGRTLYNDCSDISPDLHINVVTQTDEHHLRSNCGSTLPSCGLCRCILHIGLPIYCLLDNTVFE